MSIDVKSNQLIDMFAGLYFDKERILSIVERSGLSVPDFQDRLAEVWKSILREASSNDQIDDLVAIAITDYPDNRVLAGILREEIPMATKGPAFVSVDTQSEIPWDNNENISKLEKIIGDQNNLLPISFLEVGLEKSRSVARIQLQNGAVGTGFLADNNLLITNNHVFPTKEIAESANVQFNFQKTPNGLDLPPVAYECLPAEGFKTSKKEVDDWTIVRLSGNPNAEWGAIPIAQHSCEVRDRVLIIQHPGGSHKAIGLYHNLVTSVTETRIQYLTDTMPGSSGSPVFDNDWNLVAVHHSGGWLREPGSKAKLFRNQGIAVSCLIQAYEELSNS